MPRKVDVLLPNRSQYEVLHHFATKLYEAFCRLGYDSRLLRKEEYTKLLFDDPPDVTMGFNGAPQNEEGDLLCDQAMVPHLSLLVDPPYRFLGLQSSPYVTIACDDRVCAEMFKSVLFPNYAFCPHAVEPELATDPSSARPYDVVFLGSFIDQDKHRHQWSEQFPKNVAETMVAAAELALQNDALHFMQAFIALINEKKAVEHIEHFSLPDALQELELYVKACDRIKLIRSITSSEVHVFGSTVEDSNWKDLFAAQSNVIVHPAVNYGEALHIMQQSKIVLNSSVKSVYGAHERIFSGLNAGAAVLTSANPYLRDHFEDDVSILFYQHKELGLIDEKVVKMLAATQKRQSIAVAAQQLISKHHTWDRRINEFLVPLMPDATI